ncbi:MAG: HRDC domain-containing protein, partial [Planctomycetia bacterium]|nr:HRDC domain-containing protein [Planctomycetia bacterium]
MFIDTNAAYETFCDRLESAKIIALDTEFISERTYVPELCLVQICADGESALVDPLALRDLTRLWKILARPGHETLVLAARSELEFSLRAVGAAPFQLRDLQLAAGFVGLDYPLSAAGLHAKLLRRTLRKSETRSNWRRRPLTPEQIEYARSDVRYLDALWRILRDRLEQTDRMSWFEEEMADQIAEQVQIFTQGRWCRIAGQASLSPRQRNVLRRLSAWREDEARRRNLPPRRVVRDDLLIELARRMEERPERIFAVRGLDRPELTRYTQVVAAVVHQGMSEPLPPDTGETETTDTTENLDTVGISDVGTSHGSKVRECSVSRRQSTPGYHSGTFV